MTPTSGSRPPDRGAPDPDVAAGDVADRRAVDGDVAGGDAPGRLDRRRFLGLAAGITVATAGACSDGDGATATSTTADLPTVELPGDPFALGVASGDALADAVVLWTRLTAPGSVGPLTEEVPVRWVLSRDEEMQEVLAEGTEVAAARHGHSIHVDATGLPEGSRLWYRFEAGGFTSPVGRTRLPVAPGGSTEQVRLGVASCQAYQSGYFTAYRDIADTELDAVLFLGDFIYELEASIDARPHGLDPPTTLEEYRRLYEVNLGDGDLLAARAAHPWIVTWDDHEVEDNYAALEPGAIGEQLATSAEGGFPARRAAAYQAWWEHQPVRAAAPVDGEMRIYRDLAYGDLVHLAVVDNRQYRTPIAESDGAGALPRPFGGGPQPPGAFDEAATMLGEYQEEWLAEVLAPDGQARWRILAQQTILSEVDRRPDLPGGGFSLDGWDGYVAARQRLIDDLVGDGTGDLVVLGGDIHTAAVADIHLDPTDTSTPVVATELVGPSVSALELIQPEALAGARSAPHIHLYDPDNRGWLLVELDGERVEATFRQVDATVPDAAVTDGTRWQVVHGTPGATPMGA